MVSYRQVLEFHERTAKDDDVDNDNDNNEKLTEDEWCVLDTRRDERRENNYLQLE